MVKRFFLYLGLLAGILLGAALVLCAIMMLGKVEMFGIKYISINNEKKAENFALSEYIGIDALVIRTNRARVSVVPSEDNDFWVIYTEAIKGFVPSGKAKIQTKIDFALYSYGDHNGAILPQYYAAIISIMEPEGWILGSGTNIEVRVPGDMELDIYYMETNMGEISFNSDGTGSNDITYTADTFVAKINNGNNNIKINKPIAVNHILKTDKGTVTFNGYTVTAGGVTTSAINSNINFTTNDGVLEVKNSGKNAAINGNLIVASDKIVGGPKINVNALNGNLYVQAVTGVVTIDKIGAEGDTKYVEIFSTSVQFVLGDIYAKIRSYPIDTETPRSEYKIKKLVTPTGSNRSMIETGGSNVKVDEVIGDLKVITEKGKVTILKAQGNIEVITSSGDIEVVYEILTTEPTLDITTKEGKIVARNIQGVTHITVSADGKKKTMELFFIKSVKNNVITARDYDVTINSKIGINRYVLKSSVTVTVPQGTLQGLFSEIQPAPYGLGGGSDPDYLTEYSGYKVYRVGYTTYDDPRVDLTIGSMTVTKSGSPVVLVGTI